MKKLLCLLLVYAIIISQFTLTVSARSTDTEDTDGRPIDALLSIVEVCDYDPTKPCHEQTSNVQQCSQCCDKIHDSDNLGHLECYLSCLIWHPN